MVVCGMINNIFKNKKIFITGAGTIGSALLKRLLSLEVDTIRIFDNSEIKLHNIKCEYKDNNKIKLILGDIRDKDRLAFAMKGADIVFHTAALKHVYFCEDNPVDAVKTNVFGTQNVIDIAIRENVERVIYISTDKAVSPINVMGATKLLGERLIITASNYKGKVKTIFSSIRFGNVQDSSGSVIPIFRYQIENNLPLTVTNKDVTRFMMTIDQSIKLILDCIYISKGSEIFILKMPTIKILDIARSMNKKSGRDENNIIFTKLGIGEKLHEELITKEEVRFAMHNKDIIVIPYKSNVEYYKSIGFVNIQ